MRQTLAGQEIFSTFRGAGSTRLFVHCSLAQHQTLMSLGQALPPARNVYFDLPGHGHSAPWQGEDYQTDALRVAEALLDGPTHLVGHSFGGTVALRLAAERPDLVSQLTLIEPVMIAAVDDADARAAHKDAMDPFVAAWNAGDRVGASKAFMEMWGGGQSWEGLPTAMQERIIAQIHLIPAKAPAIEDDVHGVMDSLSDIQCPVDLIEGSATQPIMTEIIASLKTRLPQAKRHVIQNAGHMAPLSHVAQVAAVLGAE